MNKANWNKGTADEVKFWQTWLNTKGWDWKEDYNFRLDHNSELQRNLKELINHIENPRILDIGAGLLTFLGKYRNGEKLDILAIDALANEYSQLLEIANIIPPIYTELMESENLFKWHGRGIHFDLITAQNTLDHSYDPMLCVSNLIPLLSEHGVIWLNHYANTATREKFEGLHQWDFSLNANNELVFNNVSDNVMYNVELQLCKKYGDCITVENSYYEAQNQIVTLIRKA